MATPALVVLVVGLAASTLLVAGVVLVTVQRAIRAYRDAARSLERVRPLVDQLADHQAAARALPTRVPIGETRPEAARYNGEHKRLVDAIRMATYNAESALTRLLAPHYARAADEARSLLHETFATPADIRLVDNRMHVMLNPLSAPHRTRAIAALCDELTATQTLYPGTDLTLVYTVKTPADLA